MKPVDEMVELYLALADPTRIRLLNLMRSGEVCVCFFVETLQESQPKVSRHLAALRRAGLVAARRDGKWMHYSISRPRNRKAAALFDAALEWMAQEPELRRDAARLVSVCCQPTLPDTLEGAPIPIFIPEIQR